MRKCIALLSILTPMALAPVVANAQSGAASSSAPAAGVRPGVEEPAGSGDSRAKVRRRSAHRKPPLHAGNGAPGGTAKRSGAGAPASPSDQADSGTAEPMPRRTQHEGPGNKPNGQPGLLRHAPDTSLANASRRWNPDAPPVAGDDVLGERGEFRRWDDPEWNRRRPVIPQARTDSSDRGGGVAGIERPAAERRRAEASEDLRERFADPHRRQTHAAFALPHAIGGDEAALAQEEIAAGQRRDGAYDLRGGAERDARSPRADGYGPVGRADRQERDPWRRQDAWNEPMPRTWDPFGRGR